MLTRGGGRCLEIEPSVLEAKADSDIRRLSFDQALRRSQSFT